MLDVSSNSVPSLSSEEKLKTWASRLETGDPLRVAGGGAAMSNPTIAELSVVFTDMKAANTSQSNLKDDYDKAQESVAALRSEVDSLILRIWNEVETYFSEEDIESKRRKSREWGVVYSETTTDFSLTGKVTDTGNTPIENAVVEVLEAGVTVHTNASGDYNVPAVPDGFYTINVSKEHFLTQSVPNYELFDDTTKTLNVQLLADTGTLQATVYFEGLPLPDAQVTILETGQSQITNAEGQAIIPGITSGNYNAEATAPGKQPQSLPVTIESGVISLLTFNLLPE